MSIEYKDARYRNALAQDKPYKLTDGKGLYLLIQPNGGKYWRLKYRYADKEKTLAIGVYPDVSLARARQDAKNAKTLLKAGVDPSQNKQREKAAKRLSVENTFKAVALEWYEKKQGEWDTGHAEKVKSQMEADLFKSLGPLPIIDIKPSDVLTTIKKIEKRGALDVAKRQLARCVQVFRYSIQTGRLSHNPATDLVGVIKSEKVQHMKALSRDDLPAFLNKLKTFDRIKDRTRLALKLIVHTFVRPRNIREAEWDDINFERKEWRIPAHKMKVKSEHLVPLSAQAIEILEELKETAGKSNYIFPGDRSWKKPMSENALSYAMNRMGYKGKATPHGFRSTASTILNESGFKPDVIERQLAHQERNKVRAAYNRSEYLDDRREMMDWWSSYIDGVEKGTNIVPFKQSA